jgi:hypothetical protein
MRFTVNEVQLVQVFVLDFLCFSPGNHSITALYATATQRTITTSVSAPDGRFIPRQTGRLNVG